MRHLYRCPMRWADMDLLGHINNVSYLDYLQEARIDMLAAHAQIAGGEALAEGVVVVRHEVQFKAPLVFRRRPLLIESWVTEVRAATFTMAYEVFEEPSEPDGERVVYVRATSVLAPYVFAEERPRRLSIEERAVLDGYLEPAVTGSGPIPAVPAAGPRHTFELPVRFSDVDAYGHVNNVTYFEYFQESRIQYLMTLHSPASGPWAHWVVATTDVDYVRPALYRREPYAVHSWIDRIGDKSVVMCAELRDGDQVLARARVVMVTFDKETQRAAPMPDGQRRVLSAEVAS